MIPTPPPALPPDARIFHQVRTLVVEASAYCEHGYTASGAYTRPGTIATDPRVIPTGTYIVLNDRLYVAQDTGGYIKGRRIDLWTAHCADAWVWGRRDVRIAIMGRPIMREEFYTTNRAPRVARRKDFTPMQELTGGMLFFGLAALLALLVKAIWR